MDNIIKNSLGSERTVEILFINEMLQKYYKNGDVILDVGGVPTTKNNMESIYNFIKNNNVDYRVSDFRKCEYQGDFVKFDFKEDKFDTIIFLSSLEHFPQCTESDRLFREGYDRKGYEKALEILKKGGLIFLTVPFGKQRWQNYHQNYDWDGILKLTENSTILEHYTYSLKNNNPTQKISGEWILSDPKTMGDILYTDRAYGVGCFILKKV